LEELQAARKISVDSLPFKLVVGKDERKLTVKLDKNRGML
jgi:hypothetical protein